MVKYLIVLTASLIGSFYLFLLITFKKQVTMDFLIFNGATIRNWQRCRQLKVCEVTTLYNTKAIIRINPIEGFVLDSGAAKLTIIYGENNG
jgi:hypothetical protein